MAAGISNQSALARWLAISYQEAVKAIKGIKVLAE